MLWPRYGLCSYVMCCRCYWQAIGSKMGFLFTQWKMRCLNFTLRLYLCEELQSNSNDEDDVFILNLHSNTKPVSFLRQQYVVWQMDDSSLMYINSYTCECLIELDFITSLLQNLLYIEEYNIMEVNKVYS